jgi:hypothetical protein
MPIIPHGLGNEVREERTGHMLQLCEQFEPEKILLFGSYTLANKNCRHIYGPTSRRGVMSGSQLERRILNLRAAPA